MDSGSDREIRVRIRKNRPVENFEMAHVYILAVEICIGF